MVVETFAASFLTDNEQRGNDRSRERQRMDKASPSVVVADAACS